MKMKCPNCQFESRERAKFCKECGTELELGCPFLSSLNLDAKCVSQLTDLSIPQPKRFQNHHRAILNRPG
ncbi:MAG: zinc-ribbon domain-containing protein [Dehalococcoidia bacterium]|nr:zinc-ribbon domain-containing protein [Dehalococcoidia bacterium]